MFEQVTTDIALIQLNDNTNAIGQECLMRVEKRPIPQSVIDYLVTFVTQRRPTKQNYILFRIYITLLRFFFLLPKIWIEINSRKKDCVKISLKSSWDLFSFFFLKFTL